MAATLNLTEAEAKLSDVVEGVSHGEEIIVTWIRPPDLRALHVFILTHKDLQ